MKRKYSFLRFFLIGQIFLMSVVLPYSTAGVDTKASATLEYRIKAAFLLNFCKFVAWPDAVMKQDGSSIVLCVLGQDPFGRAIDAIAGKKIRGRSLEIQYADSIDNIPACHVLFVTRSMEGNLDDIILLTQSAPILTVGDMECFAPRGGMINFFIRQKKIRFEINLTATRAAGIEISSKLLKLAKISDSDHLKEK